MVTSENDTTQKAHHSCQTCNHGAKRVKATKQELRRRPHPQREMGTEAIGQERSKNFNTQGKLIGRFGGRKSLHYKGPELNGGQEDWLPSWWCSCTTILKGTEHQSSFPAFLVTNQRVFPETQLSFPLLLPSLLILLPFLFPSSLLSFLTSVLPS